MVNGHHDYSEKDMATQLTMSRMDEGDASLLVLHRGQLPEKSFAVEGRLSGVRCQIYYYTSILLLFMLQL